MDNFITVTENAVPVNLCNKLIAYYEKSAKNSDVRNRQQLEHVPAHYKSDHTLFAFDHDIIEKYPKESKILDNVINGYIMPAVEAYQDKYSVLHNGLDYAIKYCRIQKTTSGEGYHVWHYESQGKRLSNRVLVFALALNDVVSGGETEFLYQCQRFEQRTGQLLIWPAGFTHTHRGNTVLDGEKYILTGWVEDVTEDHE